MITAGLIVKYVFFVGDCRMLKVGGRVVLLVGAEFRQLLLDCVGQLNDVSKDSVQPFDAHNDHAFGSSDSKGANSNDNDVDSSRIDSTSFSQPITVDRYNIACTKYKQSVGETTSINVAESCPIWTTVLEHYVKLGETHAYICSFTKNR